MSKGVTSDLGGNPAPCEKRAHAQGLRVALIGSKGTFVRTGLFWSLVMVVEIQGFAQDKTAQS